MSEQPKDECRDDQNIGRRIAAARDQWFIPDEGNRCVRGVAEGQYLRNRLEIAFIAGYNAGISALKEPKP